MSFRNPVTCLLCPYFQQEKPVMNLMHRCYLPPEIHELVCTDELDKTAGTHRWNKKAANQLEKLNNDCNRTAGLEGELHVCLRVDLLKDAAGSFGKADRLCTCMIRS